MAMAASAQKPNELLPPVSMSTSGNSNPGSTMNSKVSIKMAPVSSTQHQPQFSKHEPTHGSSTHKSPHQHQQQQQPFHRKSIGDWNFVKTIGAGSMGKVKLAQHNSTGEICAVKIVPRAAKLYQRAHQDDPPPQTQQELQQKQKEFEKEIARDKRTTREGALGRLLFHPYVCRLYEIVPMTNHYYMLFEYVEGGQMLDYIVAHGSLKEKHARKFARGIASALDYCHRNNVVHRDLKIENIMINQKGDIKIIDFGLSNLYSPKSLLKTYCGSLYFAAPELLCAKPYVGPEVDIWSFGVVLYVLVCGKVPFDDQSVSVLHEKIKKANVEYPSFLSKECISLLSMMLQVDPSKRATLYEVINHPWINKGYEFAISSHVPKRTPLTLPLDSDIIKAISTFDLGDYQSLSDELTSIVGSVEYHMSSENWYKIMEQGRDYASASNAHILPDPTGGFHPLISIYYLVDEMKKRKKAKEEAVKVQLQEVERKKLQEQQESSQGSVAQVAQIAQKGVPTIVTEQPRPIPPPQLVGAPPQISFPEQAHTSMSPHMKTTGSQEYSNDIGSPIPEQQPQSPVQEPSDGTGKGINSLLRRLSAKKPTRGSNLSPQRTQDSSRDSGSDFEERSSPSKRDPMVRRGVSMKVTAKEKSDSRSSKLNVVDKQQQQQQQQATVKPIVREPKRTGHGRSQSINVSINNKHGFVPVENLPPLPSIDAETNKIIAKHSSANSGKTMHPTARSKSVGGHIRRDSQGGKYRAPTSQHRPLPNTMGTQNSDELVAQDKKEELLYDGFFDDILLDEELDVKEIPQLSEDEIIEQFNNAKPNTMPSIEYPKTLFLKGFFSVQTTSTKPLPIIRYSIINVLTSLGVKFQEVKGGFICSHAPSLQHEEVEDITGTENEKDSEEDRLYGDAFKSTSSSIEQRSKTPELIEPVGTNGVPALQSPSGNSRGPSRQPSLHLNTQNLSTPKGHHRQSSSISSVGSERGHRRKFSIGANILGSYRKKNGSQSQIMPPNTPAAARINKSLYGNLEDSDDYETEMKQITDDDSIDSVGNLMIGGGSDMLFSSRVDHKSKLKTKRSPLKFEIHVVKFPLVGLYGVQFKKLLGNTWNYKTLAGQILNELKL
ncbi:Serine/threonine-protein kinase [Yamadazyma tenuis]|uniref:Serine/threonine-protein kinase n=1 Tax=Candida tenuis TaxID=2315449 RepID=UPI0027A36742|nr:Serine/threonine-protein kinase [Yamadazyma tenuis]